MKRFFRTSVWPQAIAEYRYFGDQLGVRLLEKDRTYYWVDSAHNSIESGVRGRQITTCAAKRHAKTHGYTFPED